MRVVIVAVGKIKERGVREAIDDYVGRASRHLRVDEVELKDAAAKELVPAFARAIPEGAHTVALEVTGRSMTSEAFAKHLERLGSHGKGTIAFLIGGADGIPAEVSKAATDKLSLSTMTFPHRLARLMLAEQLYRAMTILRGEPYPR